MLLFSLGFIVYPVGKITVSPPMGLLFKRCSSLIAQLPSDTGAFFFLGIFDKNHKKGGSFNKGSGQGRSTVVFFIWPNIAIDYFYAHSRPIVGQLS